MATKSKKTTTKKQVKKVSKNEEKRANLMTGLAEAYGEGSVINRQLLLAFYKGKTKAQRAKLPHPVAVEKNEDTKIKRNLYTVTSAKNPSKVRDRVEKKLVKKYGSVENIPISDVVVSAQ